MRHNLFKALWGPDVESFYRYSFLESLRSYLTTWDFVAESPGIGRIADLLEKVKDVIKKEWERGHSLL